MLVSTCTGRCSDRHSNRAFLCYAVPRQLDVTVSECLCSQVLVEDYVVFKAQWQYTYGYVHPCPTAFLSDERLRY